MFHISVMGIKLPDRKRNVDISKKKPQANEHVTKILLLLLLLLIIIIIIITNANTNTIVKVALCLIN
jgi:hypothetical protein